MPGWLSTALFVLLVGFMLYRRYRRTFGPQRIVIWKIVLRITLLTLVAAGFIWSQPTLWGLVAGASGGTLGLGLGIFALRHTRFEATAQGSFYTPNGWIGLAVTALFLGRFASRMVGLYQQGAFAPQASPGGFPKSPLTLGLFLLLAGYYVSYLAGVWLASRKLVAPT